MPVKRFPSKRTSGRPIQKAEDRAFYARKLMRQEAGPEI
jgi:hypothetical protein